MIFYASDNDVLLENCLFLVIKLEGYFHLLAGGDSMRTADRETDGETDREIDAGGNDHQRLPERQQQRCHGEQGDALDVEAIEQEGRVIGGACPDLEEDQQQGEEQPLVPPGEYCLEYCGYSTWYMFGRSAKIILEFRIVDHEI